MTDREKLFKERDVEETYNILKDVKKTLNTVQKCDSCKEPLHGLVTRGQNIYCSVHCAFEELDDKLHVPVKSILDEEPKEKKERPSDIHSV